MIDALITKKERLIELLQEKHTALISHAVTKGLDSSVPMKDSGVDWLGKIPVHWIPSRIKWVAKLESGHTPDKKIEAYWTDCAIPWVSLNDTGYLRVNDYITETAYKVNELGLANSRLLAYFRPLPLCSQGMPQSDVVLLRLSRWPFPSISSPGSVVHNSSRSTSCTFSAR